MSCQASRPLITNVTRGRDGRVVAMTFRPPCDKWVCPECGVRRRLLEANWLLKCTGHQVSLYVAKVPKDRSTAVQMAFKRRGGGGRVVVGLPGGVHLHIADTDISPRRVPAGVPPWGARLVSAVDVAGALADPGSPISRGPRWVGDWVRPQAEKAESLGVVTWINRAEKDEFCFQFDLEPEVLRLSHDWGGSDPALAYFLGAIEYWRVNVRGFVRNPSVPMTMPKH